MKRLLAVVPAAVLVLAGCGDTCSSNPTPVTQLQNQCSSIAAGQTVSISLTTCPACTDTVPTCAVDTDPSDPSTIHLDSVVQQRQGNASCGSGCTVPQAVTCQVNLTAGQYRIQYNTEGGTQAVQISADSSSSNRSCTL